MAYYSKDKDIQALCEELEDRGFVMRRGGVHWKIYFPDGVRFFRPVNSTPSDFRASVKFRGDIRRMLRENNMEPLEQDQPRKKVEVTFNQIKFPKVEESKPAQRVVTDEDWAYAKTLKDSGKKYAEIAEIFRAQGIVGPGKPWEQDKPKVFMTSSSIARKFVQLGYSREYKRKDTLTPAPASAPPVAKTPEPAVEVRRVEAPKPSHPILSKITEIVTSNLPDYLKEEFLSRYVQEIR